MNTAIIERICPFCGKKHFMSFDKKRLEDGLIKYHQGALIQDAFPKFSADQREFLKTGICNDCWNNL